jgi:DNA-directed RNA polymerase specialized sigma subunit
MAERKGKKKVAQLKVEFKGEVDPEVVYLRDLVYKIRESKKQEEINAAFRELSEYLSPKIKKIVGGFKIPGCSFDDILQEAFYALQFKAIKDYNEWKGRDPSKPAPFDHFALLCIRRHLATALKTSKQNRHAAINRGISLEADHSKDNDEMSLINILSRSKDDVFFDLQHKEYFKLLVNKLWKKLTKLEKQVFVLYANHNTYEEIARYKAL